MTTNEFIEIYSETEVSALALQARRFPEVDAPRAIRQIAGRQKARVKLPSWATIDGVEYPAQLSMEQCSSETTAHYKKEMVRSLLTDGRFVDLTGGLGVDFSFLAPLFKQAVYVERNEELCRLARHNMPLVGVPHAEIICAEAEDYLRMMPPCNLIFTDPARRDSTGKRTFAIADCTPNLVELLPKMLEKAPHVLAKLSPMLDINAVAKELGDYLSNLHVVSVDDECKEIIVSLSSVCLGRKGGMVTLADIKGDKESIINIGIDDCGQRGTTAITFDSLRQLLDDGKARILLPSKTICKAGCFAWIERQYGVRSVAPDSHIFLTDKEADDFPGRIFRLENVCTMNKKELREAMKDIAKANVAVRNFPLTADQLRQKLKLKDGGDIFIFGTTTMDQKHILLITKPA